MIEKVCVKFSKCKCVLPKLSHRGRALVVNNLVASMIWHRMIVLNSPNNIVSDIQRNVIKKMCLDTSGQRPLCSFYQSKKEDMD